MSSLQMVQRAGILNRLRQNKKHWAIIFYSGNRIKDVAYALDFASVLQDASWTVSGPGGSEKIFPEGLRIGVRDPRAPCPCARLLLDTLIAVGHRHKDSAGGRFSFFRLAQQLLLVVRLMKDGPRRSHPWDRLGFTVGGGCEIAVTSFHPTNHITFCRFDSRSN
jgi:hypothetical protein